MSSIDLFINAFDILVIKQIVHYEIGLIKEYICWFLFLI